MQSLLYAPYILFMVLIKKRIRILKIRIGFLFKKFYSVFFCSTISVSAEFGRHARFCDDPELQKQGLEKLCFITIPKLPKISGWSQEIEAGLSNHINVQVPDGQTYKDAETIVYGKSTLRDTRPETVTLQALIDESNSFFKQKKPNVQINEIETMISRFGLQFRIFEYIPKGEGNWERVAFTIEIDDKKQEFLVIIVISSRTENGLKSRLDDYRKFVINYQ